MKTLLEMQKSINKSITDLLRLNSKGIDKAFFLLDYNETNYKPLTITNIYGPIAIVRITNEFIKTYINFVSNSPKYKDIILRLNTDDDLISEKNADFFRRVDCYGNGYIMFCGIARTEESDEGDWIGWDKGLENLDTYLAHIVRLCKEDPQINRE